MAERDDSLKDSPFARLASLRDSLPPGKGAAPEVPGIPRRAIVRREKKGRSGKEVTVVAELGLDATALEAWLKDLKQALGCGGVLEGELLVLQGDQRVRAKAALEARGVRRVTVG